MTAPKLRFKEFDGDWNKQRLDSFLERVSNPVNVVVDQKYTQIGIRSHGKGIFHKDSIDGKGLGNKRVFWVEPNAFVVNIVFAWERAIAVTSEAEKGMIASHRFPMYLPKNNLSNVNFLRYMFVTNKGQSYLELASPGGAGRNKTLGQSNFAELKIDLPHQKEQTKIVSFLSSVDEKISQLTQKRELLSQYKQGMMQKLFSQQIRFKADDGSEFRAWKETALGEIVQIRSGYSPSKYNLEDEGVIPFLKVEELNNCIKFQSKSRFYTSEASNDLVWKDSIIFPKRGAAILNNKVRILEKNALLDSNLMALIPSEKIFYEYLYYIIIYIELFKIADTSSIPQINNKHIEPYSLELPCLEEQTKIANFLSSIDQKIEVVAQQIEQAKTWKKGLLQQMFV